MPRASENRHEYQQRERRAQQPVVGFGDWPRPTQALKEFQQDQESELRHGPFGGAASEHQFVGCRREGDSKVAGCQDALEARVGGVLEAGHGAPGCQRNHFLWHQLP